MESSATTDSTMPQTADTTNEVVVVLDDSIPGASTDDDIVDLTKDDDIIVTIGDGTIEKSPYTTPQSMRHGKAKPSSAAEDDDVPLVAVSTAHRSKDTDVIVIEKENRKKPAPVDEYENDSRTPKRKMLSCPICMDHERAIRRAGRFMMSTKCGHIFCNDCINQSIANMRCCPTCRTKLTKKTGIHPIFI